MFQIDLTSRVPIYEQIINCVIKLVSAGALKPGDRLPSIRDLASQIGVNPNTVQKSYYMLESEGYIYSSVGRGSYITDKLSEKHALKITAIKEFKKAVDNAYLYDISEYELTQIISEKYNKEGGNEVD